MMLVDVERARAGALEKPRVIVSSNGSVIAAFHRNADFRRILLQADLIDADGMPLVLASRIFCRRPLPERVATTDFIFVASAAAAEKGVKFFFLGSKPGLATMASQVLQKRYKGLQIVGVRHGYFGDDDVSGICDEVVRSGADVLWVGLGSPLQERFAIDHRDRLKGIAWIRTCGGLFDHCAGQQTRAPLWMQRVGLEWFYRAVQEPQRLSMRYLVTNPVAAYYLLTQTRD